MLKKSKKKSKSPPSRTESKKKTTRKQGIVKKKGHFYSYIKILLFLCFLGITFIFYIIFTLPDVNNDKAIYRNPKITILSENGKKIGEFGDKYNNPISFSDIPTSLINGLISTEDKRFYSHFGIDLIAIARAIITNIQTGKKSSGASTITQQLAKNLFLSSEKSYMRKIRELFMAFYLEYNFSKEQILTLYLNRAYFGSGNYGISSAAAYYYDKKVKDLNIYESVSLIALLKSPLGYNPIINPDKSKKRTFTLLNKIYSDKNSEINSVKYSPPEKKQNNFAGYFKDWILSQAMDFLGEINQDIWITTTLDSNMQSIADKQTKLIDKNLQIAILISDYNGAIKAMIGGKNYNESQFNRATQAKRQQGSLIKPFAYLFAMKNGYDLNSEIYDSEIDINGWHPKNYSKNYYGSISLHDALVKSLNTIPAILIDEIGVNQFQEFTSKFGLNTSCTDSPVIVLGVCSNTLLDITSAYTSIASGGYAIYPYGITRIKNNKDEILYNRVIRDKNKIINQKDLLNLDNALSDVIKSGTGKKAFIPNKNIRGKTGTTQGYGDALFIGYDAGIVTSIWIGQDKGRPSQKITGGNLPAEIFKNIMEQF